MQYKEVLTWILDKNGASMRTLEGMDEKFRQNIAFVRSLGLKCDSVGWCKMDLSNPNTPEIFGKISAFCKENGWRARGIYTREYVDKACEWYLLKPSSFSDHTWCEAIHTETEDGKEIRVDVIRAYHDMNPSPKEMGRTVFVPERFRDYCLQNGHDCFDYCWVKDVGKYQAEQYFHVYGKNVLPRYAKFPWKDQRGKEPIIAAGGWLPAVSDLLYDLQMMILPDCFLLEYMPEGGIICTNYPIVIDWRTSRGDINNQQILIHRDVVQDLLAQRIVPAGMLKPAMVLDHVPGGYVLQESVLPVRPAKAFRDQMLLEYEKLKSKERPVRRTTEKEAAKRLRIAKKERKEDFQKAMPKAKAQALLGTEYEPLIPYYCVANGGYLSDECELLPHSRALTEQIEFRASMEAEELMEKKPEGIVIAMCADGDKVLLCPDGMVGRLSHEDLTITEKWPSLPQFIVDTINE